MGRRTSRRPPGRDAGRGHRQVHRAQDYRRRAADCRARAQCQDREAAREALLALARSWERMADLREAALGTQRQAG